ncbi:MAG: thiamine-phosphate kinase [Phycisphaeraceae bacterium]
MQTFQSPAHFGGRAFLYDAAMRELALLEHIYAQSGNLGRRVIVGPGDDMAVLRLAGSDLLIAVDQIADGVHFDSACDSLDRIGRKAVTRNLSDVAAMAAVPVAAVASAMLPRTLGEDKAQQLFNAMQAVGRAYDCPLVGGDVGMWEQPLQISVTVLAEPGHVAPVLRSTAKPGDIVFVSGHLGNAWPPTPPTSAPTVSPTGAGDTPNHAADFEPRLALAHALAQRLGPALHSMIDLSDGLGSDLQRICEQSHVQAMLDVSHLPLRQAARPRPDLHAPWEAALYDGEDYELCFTVAPEAAADLPDTLADVPLARVGKIVAAGSGATGKVQLTLPDGRVQSPSRGGWEHQG